MDVEDGLRNFVNWLRIMTVGVVAVENVVDADTIVAVAFAAFAAYVAVDFVVAFDVEQDSLDLDHHPLQIIVVSIVLVASIDDVINYQIAEVVDSLFRLHFGHARALVVYRMNRADRVIKTTFD